MIDIDVFQTVTSVSFEVEPNTNVININKVTSSGGGGNQNLQEVTDIGATTTNGITINVAEGIQNGISSTSSQGIGIYGSSSENFGVYGSSLSIAGVYGNSDNGYGVQGNSDNGVAVYGSSQEQIGVQANSYNGTAIYALSDNGTGLFSGSTEGVAISAYSSSNIGLEVNGNGTIAIEANLGNSNKGLVINSGASSTGNFIELDKNGVDKLVVNQQGELTATKLIKQGGTSAQLLAADGSTITAGTNITISGGTISSTGGGGGGGATNLSPSQTATNFTINSDTGTDATIPLGNGTLAGATLNDYTTTEKNKLAGIEAGANLGVPYTGATSDVNLGEFGIQLGNLEFDNTPTTIPTAQGSVYYNDADGTLDLILKGGNVTLQLGQETVIRVVNKTATNISLLQGNYQAVRITGAQGQRPKVDLAQATNDVLSAETIGLVTETIANNQEGFIITSGLIRNINTTGSIQGETWLDGDILYLSPTVAGGITKVKPIAPNHLIIIGYVIHAHVTQGTIFVKVDNGYELDELHNVKINGATNNEVLAYTLVTDIWENKTLAESGIQPTITLTTTGTSGAATLIGDTLNIPQYTGGGGSSSQDAFTILANNTNATAVPTQQVYKDIAEQTNLATVSTISWNGTAPTNPISLNYKWNQIGSLVTVRFNLVYTTAGASNSQLTISLPTDMPNPATISGFTSANDVQCYGTGVMFSSKIISTVFNVTAFRRNSTNTGYEFVTLRTPSGNFNTVQLQFTYYTL